MSRPHGNDATDVSGWVRWGASPCSAPRHGARLLPLLLVFLASLGCRAPWTRPASGEPSFDQLLEIEARQAGETFVGPAARPIAAPEARLRSGLRPAYGEVQPSDASELSAGAHTDATRLEEDLADANPAERDLILRTQLALQSQRRPGNATRGDGSQAAPRPPRPSPGPMVRSTRSEADSDVEEAVVYNLNDDEENFDLDEQESVEVDEVESDATFGRQSQVARARPSAPPPSVSSASYASNGASHDTPLTSRQKRPDDASSEIMTHPATSPGVEMNWEDHLREAIAQLEESNDASESPADSIRRASMSRLLNIAAGDLEAALQPIEGLEPAEQDYFRHQFTALHELLDPAGTPVANHRWTLALLSQRKALEHLAAVSKLEVNNLSFCTEVVSYGVVTPFPANSFKPDQEVLLYCEVDNFVSEPVKAGFETQLQGRYEIVDAGGRRVADEMLKRDAHVSRNRLRDYFIPYRMYMPKGVPAGNYTLKLTMEDIKGAKFGQAEIPFQIVD